MYSQDFTVFGGSLSEAHAEKICKVMDLAMENGAPIIGLSDSGGARIQEGVVSLGGYAEIFLRNTLASGVVPQLSLIMGPCAGGAVYSPAITDFTIMVEGTSYMFVTGPNVVKTVTHEEIDFEGLGGARVHNETSGVAHSSRAGEPQALELARTLIGYLPQNNRRSAPRRTRVGRAELDGAALDALVPDSPTAVIRHARRHRRHRRCRFVHRGPRRCSRATSSAASRGSRAAASASSRSSPKCSPVSWTSTRPTRRPASFAPAMLQHSAADARRRAGLPARRRPGARGIIRHGAKLLYAYCEATVPKVTVITRKAYGGAYDVMSSKHVRGDMNFAWPTAEIAVMGVEGAVNIIFRDRIAEAEDADAERARLVAEYEERFANPYIAAARGYVDEVILPSETRARVAAALAMLENKRQSLPPKKHGNIPL